MKRAACILLTVCLVTFIAPRASAETASTPVGDPALESPTLRCLGAYWIIHGDDNRNARVEVAYRKMGSPDWRASPPLFRVEKGPYGDDRKPNALRPPADGWVFVGSVVSLDPNTTYDLKLTLDDPDGGQAEKLLRARTISEPPALRDAPTRHVVPGIGGGSGTQNDPFKGLAAAQSQAKPGDVFLLQAGACEGTFDVISSGELGQPIVWRAAGDGEAILGFADQIGAKGRRVVGASGVHDVWFEGLTVRNAQYGIVAHESARIVIRRCHISGVDYGIAATRNPRGNVAGFFISDNLIEGPSTWPRSKGIEDARGVQVTGTGHVVCYNRIRGFADAIDTYPSAICTAIDFHNNEISECTDDGIEMDYSQRNTRCFENRFTNVYQGISVQPVYGGPVYIFRNAIYNVVMEPFKLHNSPSGALFIHNTIVKSGPPMLVYTRERFSNCVTRNNLFLGTAGRYAFECNPPTEGCDFDYDGFGGGPFDQFLRWNGVRYSTFADMKLRAPIERHASQADATTVFAAGVQPPDDAGRQFPVDVNDMRLKPGSSGAIDAGVRLPGLNDTYTGAAPDLGAYEVGAPLPHYGPRIVAP